MKKTVWIPVVLILAGLLVSCGTKNAPQAEAGSVSQKEASLPAESADAVTEGVTEKEETKPADIETDIIRKFYNTDAKLEELVIGWNENGEKIPRFKVLVPGDSTCVAAYYDENHYITQMDETSLAPAVSTIVEEHRLENASVMPEVIVASGISVEDSVDDEMTLSQWKERFTSGSDTDQQDLFETEDAFSFVEDKHCFCYRDIGQGRILKVQFSSRDEKVSAKDFYDFCGKIVTEVK